MSQDSYRTRRPAATVSPGGSTGTVEFVTAKDMPRLDGQNRPNFELTGINRGIEADSHMRHPGQASLEKSYDLGQAAVALDGNQAVGYVRLMSDRIHKGHYETLGLPAERLPSVVEIGAGIILPGYSNKGYYPQLRSHLLAAHATSILDGSMIVAGIANNEQVLRSFKYSEAFGVRFETLTVTQFHDELSGFPMTTQFFCNCTPRTDPAPKVAVPLPGCTYNPNLTVTFEDPTRLVPIQSTNGNGNSPVDLVDSVTGSMSYYTVYWTGSLAELERELVSAYRERGLVGTKAVKALHRDLEVTFDYYQ